MNRPLTPQDIQIIVCDYFNQPLQVMYTKRRPANWVYYRHIAMYFCCLYLSNEWSLIPIGLAFGGRDHGTVIHGRNRIISELEYDRNLQEDVKSLVEIISNYHPVANG